MDDGTGKLVAKIIKYREIYENVGCGEIPLRNLLERIPDVSELKPFLVEKRQGFYAMDFNLLATVLHDFYEIFLPGIFTHERIYELARRYMPEKLICDADEVELDNQSYKFLYERLQEKYKDLEEEFHTQRIRLDGCQSELAGLNIKVQSLKKGAGIYGDSTQSLMRFIRNMIDGDMRVPSAYAANADGEKIQASSDRMAKTDPGGIADCPGVYGFKRPSWFTKLRAENELNRKNAARKAAGNTSPLLKAILRFWEGLDGRKLPPEEKADIADRWRHDMVARLINDTKTSNEEKYLKYILLTPGMPKGYMNTLNGASELGLNAAVVIKLLEQPAESFNKEIIEAYVSKAHKGTEYNLKQELAEELICGKWSVRSSLNGKEEVYQLVPYARLQELAGQFEKAYDALERHSAALRAAAAQSVAGEVQEERKESAGFDHAWEKVIMNDADD